MYVKMGAEYHGFTARPKPHLVPVTLCLIHSPSTSSEISGPPWPGAASQWRWNRNTRGCLPHCYHGDKIERIQYVCTCIKTKIRTKLFRSHAFTFSLPVRAIKAIFALHEKWEVTRNLVAVNMWSTSKLRDLHGVCTCHLVEGRHVHQFHYILQKYGQSPKWSSAKRVFEKRVVKIIVKTLMLIDLWPWPRVLTWRHALLL